jgi:hypothetical protein
MDRFGQEIHAFETNALNDAERVALLPDQKPGTAPEPERRPRA